MSQTPVLDRLCLGTMKPGAEDPTEGILPPNTSVFWEEEEGGGLRSKSQASSEETAKKTKLDFIM